MIERYFIPVLIGFAPVLLALSGWTYASPGPVFTQILSGYSVPIIGMEIVVIIIALRDGLVRSARVWLARPMIWLPLAALVSIAFGTAFFVAPNRVMALILTGYWVVHLCFAAAVTQLCGKVFAPKDLVSAYLWAFPVFLGLIVLFAVTVPDPRQFNWTNGFPGFGHIRHMGYLAAGVGGLALGRFAVTTSRRQRWMSLAILCLALAFALWCGTRGAAAAIVGGLIGGMILLPAIRSWRTLGGFLMAAGIAICAAWMLPAPADNMGLGRTVTATTGNQGGGITTGRIEIWGQVYDQVLNRPLFGHGEGQTPYISIYDVIDQPHNALIQFLLAWGFVGTALAAILAAQFALPAFRSALANSAEIAPPFLTIMTLLTYAAFDGTLFHPISVSIVAGCCGILASSWSGSQRQKS